MQPVQSQEQVSAVSPGQRQQPAQQGGGQGGAYPDKPQEAFKFANNIMEELWRDGENSKWIKKLTSMPSNMPIEQGIGVIAGQLVGEMLGQLRSSGRRPTMKLALGAVQTVVSELVEVGNASGMEIPEGVEEPATAVATKIIDDTTNGAKEAQGKMSQGGGQQQQPTGQQQQGAAVQPQGVIQ